MDLTEGLEKEFHRTIGRLIDVLVNRFHSIELHNYQDEEILIWRFEDYRGEDAPFLVVRPLHNDILGVASGCPDTVLRDLKECVDWLD